jgi:hypothetical protein
MRVLAAIPLAAIGAWTALCAVALNSDAPWLALGIAAPATATYALPGGWPRLGFIAGWLTVLAIALLGRPEGDWVIAADWHGYTLLGSGLVFLTYAVGTVPRRAQKPGNRPSPT